MQNSSEHFSGELDKRYQITSLIIVGQILTALLLVAVSWLIAPRIDLDITEQTTTALWIFIIFVAACVLLLRRFLFSWQKLRNINLTKGVEGLISTLQTDTILLGVLTEVIAIVGFLVSVMTGNKFEMFRAAAIALVIFLMIFPRKTMWATIVNGLNKPIN
jgi:hypothetical protein